MATPVWTTTAGKIASIDEQASFSLQLEANDPVLPGDSTAIVYSVIAGSLPAGMQVTSTGLLTGTPAEVAKRTLYTFVVRATAGTKITDRTFTLDVVGADAPTFNTASGQLKMDDSTRVGLYWIIDGASMSVQLSATDSDTASGQQLVYELVSGSLPPGLTMTTTGLISGVVQLTDDQRYGERGGYDGNETYDGEPYDKTIVSKSISKNFEFIVRVSDGVSSTEQTNSIFVYSADFWRVSNTAITIDMNAIDGSPLTMDFSASRRPVFKTGSDLGTFRHNNNVAIKIDVEDFDPLQADLEYTIQAGSLPSGLNINVNSGEIYGTLARQPAVETTYNFTVRANRVVQTGVNVFTDQQFTMKVIGEIDIGIEFTTASNVGTLKADIPSILSIEAVAEQPQSILTYTLTAGSLPPGITLSSSGNLIGTIDSADFTDSTRAFTFTVAVSNQYQTSASTKEFTLSIDIPFTSLEYGNMTGHATSLFDQNLFYNIAQDYSINNPEYMYRPEDENFGMKNKPDMLMMAGLEAQTLTTFQQQMEQNHSPKKLYFGDLKTAVAKENGITKYEVVYIEVKDDMVNGSGQTVSSTINLRSDIATPVLGPRASDTYASADYSVYEVTTDGGLSFSTSGSKVRYANQLSADLGFINRIYPNAVANMRSRMKTLGHKEYDYLPLWMKTTQSGDLAPLGFVLAVPVCYCKPGTAELVKKRISDKNIEFKNISFIVDRYIINKSKTATPEFIGDGSTKVFVVNEIVHEQDILIKEGTDIVIAGEGWTASGFAGHINPTADTELRSADHEYGISLSVDSTNKTTTITFTKKVPEAGTIISVDRVNAKYLKFRDKGIF
jgi:hypothetical protein